MKNSFFNAKNLLWAAAVVLCLLALLIGLIFSMSQKNNTERMDGTITLGEIERKVRAKDPQVLGLEGQANVLIPLPESPKGNLDSVFGMTFLCDKTILGLYGYASHYGDGIAPQIWTDSGSGISVKDAADTPIVFADGSLITPANAAMVMRPKTLVIYLGGDGLADTTQQEFIDGYGLLIDSIRANSPDTAIIVCSIASVSSNYQGTDGLNPQLIARANKWIRQVCIDKGVYYADLAAFLNDENGYLSDAYLTPDGRSIAAAGIALIVDYFRFHGV